MKTILALLLGLATATPLAAQDTIKFKDPTKYSDLEGDIVTLTFTLVEIEVPVGNEKVKQVVDPRLIAELSPRRNFDFLKGVDALENEDFVTAVARFQRAADNPRDDVLVKQQAAMMIVRTHFSAGNYPAAVEAAQALRKRKADCFYVGESLSLEARALLAMTDQAAAKAAIASLTALGKARAIPDWVKDADLLDASLAELQKNWRAALAAYRKYAADSRLAEEAALGELRCLTALSDFPGLAFRATAILKATAGKKNTRHRLLVAAYTARGDVEAKAGNLKEALFDYLYGAMVLGLDDRGLEHETAIARSVVACSTLAAAERDPARQTMYRARAREQFQEMRRVYPRPGMRLAPPEEPR